MDITGQSTLAPKGELKLRSDLKSVSALVNDINGEFLKLEGMGAEGKDPVLLRFKLRVLSALQKTTKIVSVSEEKSIPEIAELLSPREDSKSKSKFSALGSKLLKRKTRSADAKQKSVVRYQKKNNETKNLRINVRHAMGAYFKEILAAKSAYLEDCKDWYKANGVKIKGKLQSVAQRKSIRDGGAFPQVIVDLKKTLDCLKQLVDACGKEATEEDVLLFEEMYAKPETHLDLFVTFFNQHAELLSLLNIRMQQLEECEAAKDLTIAEETWKFVKSLERT